jgi:hypothetical protein
MALLAYQSIRHVQATGGGISLTTPNTSDTVAPDPTGFLYFENTNAAPRTITILSPAGLDFGVATLADQTYTLAATTGRQWIPCSPQLADPGTGLITVNIDATAGVTRAAIRR